MSDAASSSPPLPRAQRWLLLLVLVAGGAIRCFRLDATLFWVDEAESTINALTIREHGVPVDRWLGQPIFENTLVEPWPDHPEYEFRDSSYSRKGLATYHGWLPLYAIAASLELTGIGAVVAAEPATPTPTARALDGAGGDTATPLVPKHDDWTMRRLTLAARLPSVVAGTLFLLLLFLAGREIVGAPAAWGALAVATCADVVIAYARDARYYSWTLLFGTAACWSIWRLCRHGRWRDVAASAVALALLFHCHVVSCVIGCFMVAATAPVTLRRPGGLVKLAVVTATVALSALPWALWSGFLEQAGAIPKAWPLLDLPRDLLDFPLERPGVVALLALGIAGAAACALLPARGAAARWRAAFGPKAAATAFLGAWIVVGWISFVVLMPAVSNVFTRMALPILGPGLLLAGATVAASLHLLRGRQSVLLTTLVLLTFVFLATDAQPILSPRDEGLSRNLVSCIDWLRRAELPAGTRLYATPNGHLTLSLYTGLPVQSIAPVRREFLATWPGDVVLFETCGAYMPPSDHALERAAGSPLPEVERRRLRPLLTREAARRRVATMAREVVGGPPAGAIDARYEALIADLPAETRRAIARRAPTDWCPAVFRGFPLDDWTDWWRIYFFRFVDPDSRRGAAANFAGRMRDATAELLPHGWTVFRSPARGE